MGLFDDIYGAVAGKASSLYEDAKEDLNDWWQGSEDKENLPQNYQQTAYNERLAEGSAIPVVQSAQDADGRTVISTPQSPLSAYQPYLIGGGIFVVVLLVVMLMMGRR